MFKSGSVVESVAICNNVVVIEVISHGGGKGALYTRVDLRGTCWFQDGSLTFLIMPLP